MKKLFFILLGLASINTYGYDVTRGALQNNSALCGYGYNPNCGSSGHHQQRRTTEIINIDVPSRYGAWAANVKTGESGGSFDMESLEAAKAQAIKTCEQGGRNAPCKICHGYEMVVLLLLKVNLVKNGLPFRVHLALVLRRPMP